VACRDIPAERTKHADSNPRATKGKRPARISAHFSGSDLEEIVSNAALFVLPSEIEGLSLALLDAMASGVCVLTSDIPENNEVVEGAGFTFHRGDQADLERMLDLLIHNPELRRQSADRERKRIQSQYLWPAIARSIETAYYNVLGWNADGNRTREQKTGDQIQIPASAVQAATPNRVPFA
jgi:glycosyltransferase involved in cell wall biosynthesis